MTRIAEFAFKGSEAKEDDERLARRMKLLAFLTPEVSESCVDSDVMMVIMCDRLWR